MSVASRRLCGKCGLPIVGSSYLLENTSVCPTCYRVTAGERVLYVRKWGWREVPDEGEGEAHRSGKPGCVPGRRGMNLKMDLCAVSYEERGRWLCHCLELDVVAEGDNGWSAAKELGELLEFAVSDAVDHEGVVSIIHPAPAEFWEAFWRGEVIRVMQLRSPDEGKLKLEVRIAKDVFWQGER